MTLSTCVVSGQYPLHEKVVWLSECGDTGRVLVSFADGTCASWSSDCKEVEYLLRPISLIAGVTGRLLAAEWLSPGRCVAVFADTTLVVWNHLQCWRDRPIPSVQMSQGLVVFRGKALFLGFEPGYSSWLSEPVAQIPFLGRFAGLASSRIFETITLDGLEDEDWRLKPAIAGFFLLHSESDILLYNESLERVGDFHLDSSLGTIVNVGCIHARASHYIVVVTDSEIMTLTFPGFGGRARVRLPTGMAEFNEAVFSSARPDVLAGTCDGVWFLVDFSVPDPTPVVVEYSGDDVLFFASPKEAEYVAVGPNDMITRVILEDIPF
jgi:hypothetical protein